MRAAGPHEPLVAFFRVQASHAVGTGHLFRCYAIARALAAAGVPSHFITSAETIALYGSRLPGIGFVEIAPATDEARDAAETGRLLAAQPPGRRIVVVDDYQLGVPWEKAMSPDVTIVAAVDDLGRPHAARLVIDHNLPADPSRYAAPGTELLLGAEYALLRPEIVAAMTRAPAFAARENRIFICFGGSDPACMTERALRVVSQQPRDDCSVTVVVGAAYRGVEALVALGRNTPRTAIAVQPANLAELMAGARIAIGAGGIMHYERCALGVPSITVTIADNQVRGTEALNRLGCTSYLGPAETLADGDLAGALKRMLSNVDELQEISRRCSTLVDGRGPERVAQRLLALLPV